MRVSPSCRLMLAGTTSVGCGSRWRSDAAREQPVAHAASSGSQFKPPLLVGTLICTSAGMEMREPPRSGGGCGGVWRGPGFDWLSASGKPSLALMRSCRRVGGLERLACLPVQQSEGPKRQSPPVREPVPRKDAGSGWWIRWKPYGNAPAASKEGPGWSDSSSTTNSDQGGIPLFESRPIRYPAHMNCSLV